MRHYPAIFKGNKPYNDYTGYIKNKFGQRVQKISVHAGFTCPNRDGTKASGGCTYCNNRTFNPYYCLPQSDIKQQLLEGIDFFSKKYKSQKYLAYFQAFTNTYASAKQLDDLYKTALSVEGVIGLVIATRPDCVSDEVLDLLEKLSKKYYLMIEFGIESCYNETLQDVNRAHTFEDTISALKRTANRGLNTGGHIILGLPGENREKILSQVPLLSKLPLTSLKLHQLQIIKGTKISKQYEQQPGRFTVFTPEQYIELIVDFLENLNAEIVVERFISESPLELVISPRWNGLKNFEIISRVQKRMKERNTWQGKFYNITSYEKDERNETLYDRP